MGVILVQWGMLRTEHTTGKAKSNREQGASSATTSALKGARAARRAIQVAAMGPGGLRRAWRHALPAQRIYLFWLVGLAVGAEVHATRS
jgi:hypothetical protein